VRGIKHPFSGALYEPQDGGTVLVTLDGSCGMFTGDGRWLEGELREADPHLCGWVGGPKVRHHRLEARDI
jgi:hypothetical protein